MPNNRFSAVQLTLLSVIVALILENLLNQFANQGVGWTGILPWLQSAVVALTVIAVWSGFALILTSSERKPEPVDFIYPFGLLITLTLAANSLGEAQLARFFMFLSLGGIFACWALRAEFLTLPAESDQAFGVRRAFYIQATDCILCLLMSLMLFAFSLPLAVTLVALGSAVIIQAIAAQGTMRGWRAVSAATQTN